MQGHHSIKKTEESWRRKQSNFCQYETYDHEQNDGRNVSLLFTTLMKTNAYTKIRKKNERQIFVSSSSIHLQ